LKILGIWFGATSFMSRNFNILIEKFKLKLQYYNEKSAAVSMFSRAKIANTFLLPILWYVLKILDPNDSFYLEICDLVEKFVWNGNKRWVGRFYFYLPVDKGGLGVLHPKVQAATFRFSFINKILTSSDTFYFCDFSSQNVFNLLTKNSCKYPTPFYLNLTKFIEATGLHFNSMPLAIFNEIDLNNQIFMKGRLFPYLTKAGVTTLGEYAAADFPVLIETVRASSRRLLNAEIAFMDDRIKDIEPFEDAPLSLSSVSSAALRILG